MQQLVAEHFSFELLYLVGGLPTSANLGASFARRLQVCTANFLNCIAAGDTGPGTVAFDFPRDTDVAGTFGGHWEMVERLESCGVWAGLFRGSSSTGPSTCLEFFYSSGTDELFGGLGEVTLLRPA